MLCFLNYKINKDKYMIWYLSVVIWLIDQFLYFVEEQDLFYLTKSFKNM